jgi:NADH-quinone oxidoreductase subunit M
MTMGSHLDAHLISWVVFLPLATGLLLLAASGLTALLLRSEGLPALVWRPAALASSGVTFLIAVAGLWGRFDPEETGYQLMEWAAWLPQYGIHYFVGIDGISLVLVLLTTLLMPVMLLASWNDIQRSRRSYLFFMLFFETAVLGSFVSLNLFQFYLFWGVMLVPMYFIIGIWGGAQRIQAATRFLLSTLGGSLLLLVAMIVVYRLNYEQGGAFNFDLVHFPGFRGAGSEAVGIPLLETDIPVTPGPGVPWWQTQLWLFVAFSVAFGIQLPLVPLHSWLPRAQVEAPTGGSVVLAGLLIKVAGYGFLRFALPLFPVAATESVGVMFSLALIGIVYGSLLAMAQRDLKQLVAYSSLAQMGFVVLGLFALNLHGVTGAVVQMVSHGLATGALFILVGFLYGRRQTSAISDYGGLTKPMPVFAALFGIVVMSSIGLPALAGFVGEFLVLLGAFGVNPWAAAVATTGIALAAATMLWMFRRVMFGPLDKPENRGLIDLDLRERAVVIALILPILWIGIHPNPLLRRIEPSVSLLLQEMDLRRVRSARLEVLRRGPAVARPPTIDEWEATEK